MSNIAHHNKREVVLMTFASTLVILNILDIEEFVALMIDIGDQLEYQELDHLSILLGME